MEQFNVKPIGRFEVCGGEARIVLDKAYIPALEGLDGFSHVNVIWWFSGCDDPKSRGTLRETSPYKGSPAVLGTFATRSPQRPNPLALSCVQITCLDTENGVINIAYADASDGTPVLDIKPYTPSLDRVETPCTPQWCAHWPKNIEESGDFDWASQFNFL